MSQVKNISNLALCHLHNALKKDPSNLCTGICGNYGIVVYTPQSKLVAECAKELGVFSGYSTFPIKHKNLCCLESFDVCPLWDKRTKYGKDRWAVLELMRSEVAKELSLRKNS